MVYVNIHMIAGYLFISSVMARDDCNKCISKRSIKKLIHLKVHKEVDVMSQTMEDMRESFEEQIQKVDAMSQTMEDMRESFERQIAALESKKLTDQKVDVMSQTMEDMEESFENQILTLASMIGHTSDTCCPSSVPSREPSDVPFGSFPTSIAPTIGCTDPETKMKDANGDAEFKCSDFTAAKCTDTAHLALYEGFTSHCPDLCDTCATCQDSQMEFNFGGKTKNCATHVKKGTADCDDPDYAASCRMTCGGCAPPTSVPTSAPTSAPTSVPTSAPTIGCDDPGTKMKDANGDADRTCSDFSVAECTDIAHLDLYEGFTSHCPDLCDTCATCQDSEMEFKFGGKTKNCVTHVIKGTADCDDPDYAASCREQCEVCTPPTSAPTAAPTNAPTAASTSTTSAPTSAPMSAPTSAPTSAPSSVPTSAPTSAPTSVPTSAPTIACTDPDTKMKDNTGSTSDRCSDFTVDKCTDVTHLVLYVGFTSHCPALCDTCPTCQDSQMEFNFGGKSKKCAAHETKGTADCDDPDYAASCREQCEVCTP